ncbi:MAG: LPS export ABC transporter periplasmic protein LptC [Bacteroidetes bacterium]|nr:LPS export ABC transporter periplasmic protein LptC [Bacteroidota bacterium]
MIRIKKEALTKMIPGLFVAFMAMYVCSCNTDIQKVKALTSMDSLPDISIDNIIVKQSESGNISTQLTAPKLKAYQAGNNPYTEFPNGIKIIFFDSLRQPKSELTAKYGISWDNKRLMEAKGNVVVKNFAKQAQLNTEHLTWNENTRRMYSEVYVKISTPEKIITGKSMESDEVFDNWVVRNVSGTFYVNERR